MRFPRHKPYQLPAFLPARHTGPNGRTVAIPGYRQSRNYSCGFAATLMVARYYSPTISASGLYDSLGTSRDGTRQTAIVRELRALGLAANTRYDVDFERLQREVERDKLLISYLFDDEHWLVVYGYSADPLRVYVADPRPGYPCVYDWNSYGHRLGQFAIVCSPGRRRSARDSLQPAPIHSPERLLEAAPGLYRSKQIDFDFGQED